MSPSTTLHPFVARSSKMLRKEVDELERVLIWSTHFVSKKTQDTSKRPSLLEFPYKKLFASTGSRPSYTIKQSLGHKFHVIQNSLNELCDKMRIAMSHCLQCDPIYGGFHVPYSGLENYLEHNLVVEADKDSSIVLMSRTLYLREAQLNMDSVFNNAPVYQFLGPRSSLTDWVDKGHAWQRKVASWLLHFYPDHLREFLCTFMDSYSKPVMPKFRLLVKTHKSASVDAKGGFSSRPLVGLFCWATTPSSILLGVAGLILLKIHRQLHPMASPIIDSYDLLSRLRKHFSTNTHDDWKCSTIDFSAMYTRVTWEHTLHTYNYWRNVFYNCDRSTLHISKVELAFLDFVFTPINQFAMHELGCDHPYFELQRHAPTIGLALLHFVYMHTVFLSPGLGVYRQAQGWPMGTNEAPPWAQLTLRSYEHAGRLPSDCVLFRFLDDGLILHRSSHTVVKQHLDVIYPPNLPWSFEVTDMVSDIHFLDVHIVALCPLKTSVYWKPTHTCSYIRWDANVPRHIRIAWVRGEFIRYIRICSSCSFYRLCCQRLIRALLFLNYPKHVIQAQAIDWDDRHKYTTLRRDSAASGGGRDAVDSHIVSLSQAEQNPHSTIGPIVHVLRVVHHSALPLRWSSVVHGLKSRLPFIPGLKLFAILRPLPNIKRLFRRWALRALQQPIGS